MQIEKCSAPKHVLQRSDTHGKSPWSRCEICGPSTNMFFFNFFLPLTSVVVPKAKVKDKS